MSLCAGFGVRRVCVYRFKNYGVLFYGVFCSWCPCVCYVFAVCACGVLCDVVWFVFVVFFCLGGCFVTMFVWCVYGLQSAVVWWVSVCVMCSCCCVCVRVGLNVYVRFVCDCFIAMLYGVFLVVCFVVFVCVFLCVSFLMYCVTFVWYVLCVFVFVRVVVKRVCGFLAICCAMLNGVFLNVIWCLCVWLCLCFVCELLCDDVWCGAVVVCCCCCVLLLCVLLLCLCGLFRCVCVFCQ